VTASSDDYARQIGPRPGARAALEDVLRIEGLRPIESADDLVCEGVFESDEELEEFLEFTYAARRADIA
jgi:hypothetical protein